MIRRAAILPLLLCCIAAESQTELQTQQEAARKRQQQTVRNYRELPQPLRLSDLVQVRVEEGQWRVTPRVPEGVRNASVRAKIEGINGIGVLSVHGAAADGPPNVFSLSIYSFDDPKAIQVTTTLSCNYGVVNVGRYVRLLDGYRNTRLYQRPAFGDDGQTITAKPSVHLSVQSGVTGAATVSIERSAPDFVTLRRDYAAEVDEHLRPLLRELHMESLLAADPLIAWQVFGDEIKADPAIVQRITDLLPALDSDSYREQQAALAKLGEIGLPLALAISQLDRSQLSAQQNALIDAAMQPYRPEATFEPREMKNDLNFLIDCLYLDDPTVRQAALRNLSRIAGRKIEFSPAAPGEELSAQVDRLRMELASKRNKDPRK